MGLRAKLRTLLTESAAHLRHDGIGGLRWPLWMTYNEVFVRGVGRRRFGYQGQNIFETDWDLLVILDACRPDLFDTVDTPDFLAGADTTETRLSIAPDSSRFLEWTFTGEYEAEIEKTAYVSANPHTDLDLPRRDFAVLDEVWRYAWDDALGTVPARPVTDRAIDIGRSTDVERTIVHYMQPHFPSIPGPQFDSGMDSDELGEAWTASVWQQLLRGEASAARVWESYVNNLEYVLDEVAILAENFAAETAILTADHGNAMGERGFYGHDDYPVRTVWEVPWIGFEAVDSGSHEPADYDTDVAATSIDDQLEALGYV